MKCTGGGYVIHNRASNMLQDDTVVGCDSTTVSCVDLLLSKAKFKIRRFLSHSSHAHIGSLLCSFR